MAVLGPRLCARAPSSCGKRGPLFIAVRGPLTTAASLVAEHRLQTRRLSNRGSRAQPLRGMRDPPGPGLEPLSPALAGRLSTTAPPGKPDWPFLKCIISPSRHSWLSYCFSLSLTKLMLYQSSYCTSILYTEPMTQQTKAGRRGTAVL